MLLDPFHREQLFRSKRVCARSLLQDVAKLSQTLQSFILTEALSIVRPLKLHTIPPRTLLPLYPARAVKCEYNKENC